MSLTWQYLSTWPAVASWQVEYEAGGSGKRTADHAAADGQHFTVLGISAETGVSVRVRGVNADGNGPWSAPLVLHTTSMKLPERLLAVRRRLVDVVSAHVSDVLFDRPASEPLRDWADCGTLTARFEQQGFHAGARGTAALASMEIEFGSGPNMPSPSEADAVVVGNIDAVWDALLTDPVLHDGRLTGVYRVEPVALATGVDWRDSTTGETRMFLTVEVDFRDS